MSKRQFITKLKTTENMSVKLSSAVSHLQYLEYVVMGKPDTHTEILDLAAALQTCSTSSVVLQCMMTSLKNFLKYFHTQMLCMYVGASSTRL